MNRGKALSLLGLSGYPTRDQIKKAYRMAASVAHPDKGGSHEQMVMVTEARTYLYLNYVTTGEDDHREFRQSKVSEMEAYMAAMERDIAMHREKHLLFIKKSKRHFILMCIAVFFYLAALIYSSIYVTPEESKEPILTELSIKGADAISVKESGYE